MSRLEKFINDNREEFDDAAPPEHLWAKVEAAALAPRKRPYPFYSVLKWCVAAGLLLMVPVTIYWSFYRKAPVENGGLSVVDSGAAHLPPTATLDAPEMNEFTRLITLKQEELKSLAREQPVLYKQFSADINQLDSSYNTLKLKLSISPNREMLIEAMIQNLQLQLRVLNKQLHIIQQIKNAKKYNYENNKSFT